MSGWEEAEGEGRGGGRDDEGENEMRMERRDATIGGGATAPVFRTAAGQRRVSHDRVSLNNNSKCLDITFTCGQKKTV